MSTTTAAGPAPASSPEPAPDPITVPPILAAGAASALTIAEAAEATGLTTHTLRYYERDGLMPDAVERAASGHRRYTERDLGWIVMITRLRSTGMPIREIRAYAMMVRAGAGNEAQRLELLRRHRDRVLADLTQVREHLAAIEHKITLYEGLAGGPDDLG